MEFSVKSGSPEKQRSACIVVGVLNLVVYLLLPNNSTKLVMATSARYCAVVNLKAKSGRHCYCTMCLTFFPNASC